MTDLDKAFQTLTDDQQTWMDYYNQLLNTDFFVPTHDTPGLTPGTQRLTQEARLQVKTFTREGREYLPIFDTLERLRAFVPLPTAYVMIPAYIFLSQPHRATLLINPGTEFAKDISERELGWLQEVIRNQGPESVVTPAGTKLTLGPAEGFPEPLREKLFQCLQKNREVNAGYLVQVVPEGGKSQYILLVRADGVGPEVYDAIFQEIGMLIRGGFPDGGFLDLKPYQGEGFDLAVTETVPPLFSR